MSQEMFITKKIAAGYIIQRKNPTAWLTPEGTWDQSIFEGAAFEKRRDAEQVFDRDEEAIRKES